MVQKNIYIDPLFWSETPSVRIKRVFGFLKKNTFFAKNIFPYCTEAPTGHYVVCQLNEASAHFDSVSNLRIGLSTAMVKHRLCTT